MIIDIKKVKIMCEYSNKSFLDIKFMLEQCEMKSVDCNRCSNKNICCHACLHRKDAPDMFTLKQNELDKLFFGAPVVVKKKDIENNNFRYPTEYESLETYKKGITEYKNIRLPTIKESPFNEWLCPPLEMPKELYELRVLLWAKNGQIKLYNKGRCEPNNIAWENIIKFQIIK